jgi:hypothetical protein
VISQTGGSGSDERARTDRLGPAGRLPEAPALIEEYASVREPLQRDD